MEQIDRLFRTGLYGDSGAIDDANRFRMDDWELRDDVQDHCKDLWKEITTENLFELTDYAAYKVEFLKLFGFTLENVDYGADVNPVVDFDIIDL